MAIPFLSDIRLPSSGKVYLWTGHNSNFLQYNLWHASSSGGMFIKNISSSGDIYFQTNSTTALTIDSSQNVIAADAFTGKLQGAVTGSPDTTIWRVSGQYTNWGIFYNEGSPDKIEFKAGGTVTSSIALDNGDITTSGNIYLNNNKTIFGKNTSGSNYGLLTITSGNVIKLGAYAYTSAATQIGLGNNGKFLIGTEEALSIDNSKNASFAGHLEVQNSQLKIRDTSTNHQLTLQSSVGGNARIMAHKSNLGTNQNLDIVSTQIDLKTGSISGSANASALLLDSSKNATFAGAGTFETTLNVSATDDGGSPAMTAIMNMHGYDQRGVGIKMKDNVNTSGGGTDAEWFVGTGYSQTGFNIGYASDGSQSSYAAQNKLSISTAGDATFAGDITISNATPAINLTDTDNSSNIALSSVGGALIVNSPSDQVYQYGGAEKFRISTSTHTSAAHVVPGADSTYHLGSNSVRWANVYADTLHGTVALSSEASNLGSFDDRDMAPEDMSFSDDLKLFFVEKSGIEGGTVGSNWQDALFISSYVDASGGNPNLLAFDKSEKKIYHYQASATATSWGTPKELAYTSDFVKRTGGTSTSMSGDLHIIAGAPKIYLQDNTDDDDQQIVFRNNGGSDEYKIATQDFTSAGTGDGLFIGSETTDPVKLVTNDTIALAIDSSQHVSLPGAYLTLKDINSHAQIEASSSSLMIKAANIQAQGNLIPDGTGNRNLGASNRYWAETYTNGVTSGGNIVINSNTPVLTLGVSNSSTGNSKIQFYSKNSGTSNGYALQYNKDTGIDRLEFIDGSGTANIKFNNGGTAEFVGSVTASTINTGQGATEVHLMNQNLRTTDDVTFDDLTVTGNLTITGDINSYNVTDLDITDKTITLGKGQDEGHSGGSGLVVDGSSASILWDESNDTWDFNKGINVGSHIELDSARGVVFDNSNSNNAWYIRNGGSNSATLQFGLGASPGSNIKHTFAGDGSVTFATYVNAATGFRMASGQAIDFVSTNIGYNSIERNTSVGGLQINTGDTASMNILDNGNVGINSTSPEEKLTIATGNVQFRQTAQAANASLGFLGWKNTYATGTHVAAKIDVLTRNESSNAHDYTNLVFYTWNGYNSLSEKMRIADDGNVGIGYDNPYKKLHLHNPTDSGTPDCQMNFTTGVTEAGDGNGFRVGWNGTVANVYLFENADMRFATNNSERMRIKADGKVGIGTTTPIYPLHVVGNIYSNSGTIFIDSNRSLMWGNSNQGIKAVNNSSMTFSTGGGARMTLASDGKLGIGTASPSEKLEVSGGHIKITNAGNTNLYINANNSNSDATIFFEELDSVKAKIQHDASNDSMLFTDGAYADTMTLKGAKVGIGTTSPSKTLHVAGPGGSSGGIMIAPTSGDAEIQFQDSGVTNAYITLDDGTGDMNFRDDSATVLTVDFTNEKVGIGTTSPATPLEVKSTGNTAIRISTDGDAADKPQLQLFRSAGAYSQIHYEADGGSNAGLHITDFRNDSNSHIIFNTSGDNERMRIESDGKVGIGTASPTYKLSVSGGIEAGGKITYSKSAGSLNATGYAVAGITASANGNGSSCGFTFTCFGHTGAYQKIVYSCYNGSGTWYAKKVIDEGTNQLDVAASANGSTITFTFKATSSTMSYTPRVTVEATGHNINSTYA